MNPPRWPAWLPAEPEPPSDEPLPPPSDDPLPAPEDPGPRTEEDDTEEENGPEPEITDDPLPEPEDPREGEPPLREQQEPAEDELTELDTDGGVFDCGLMDPSCHISNWFADFVVSGLNPGLAWLAEKAFYTPTPTAGMSALHEGILTTANVLYLLLVVAGGVIVMGHQTVQSRYSIGDILPRLVFGFVAANFSLWVATEMVKASNDIAAAVGAAGIDAEQAAINFRNRFDVLLEEALVFVILLLVVVVVLLVVWMITEAVRICMVIVLTIAAPVLLMFHALPHTNRLAELWWRSMAGLCAIPVAQAIAFIAMARLFFEGQMTIFGTNRDNRPYNFDEDDLALDLGDAGTETVMLASGVFASPDGDVRDSDWLMNIMLLLVLLYVQIRISSWVMKLVWQPNPGTSPIAAMLKNLGWMMAFRSMGNVRLSGLMKNGFDLGLRRPDLSWARRSRGTGRPLPRDKPKPSSGLQRLQPQTWWYRYRREAPEPVADLNSGERRALPGPGGSTGPRPHPGPEHGGPRGSRGLPGQPELPPAPGSRPGRAAPETRHVPAAPARRALEEGRMPGSPTTGQQTLFPRPSPPPPKGTAPGHPPRRRWRQGVLPTPPPVRVPVRRPVERVGDLPGSVPAAGLRHLPSMPTLSWRKPPHVKGQQSLLPAPKRVWKQYGLFPKPKK